MSEKKESVRGSVVAEKKKSSVRGSQIVAAVVEPVPLTPEVWFDPKEEEEALALAEKEAQVLLEMRALPVRQYLEASVVPLLLHGLQLLAIERPENPVDFLAKYLMEKNPIQPKKEEKKGEKKEEEEKEGEEKQEGEVKEEESA